MTRYWNLIALLFSVISMSSIADDTTHTGVVRIEGIITAKTCIVADESKNFTVNMPDVPSYMVRNSGSVTEYQLVKTQPYINWKRAQSMG